MKAKKARSRKKVQCTFTSIPENRPILKAPPIKCLSCSSLELNSLCGGSAEREAISLHPRIEKLDLELPVSNGLRLPDQLVQPLFADRAVAPLVDVGSVSGARRISVDEYAKRHGGSPRWGSHHEVHVARMEPDRNPSWRLAEHCRVLSKRPDA